MNTNLAVLFGLYGVLTDPYMLRFEKQINRHPELTKIYKDFYKKDQTYSPSFKASQETSREILEQAVLEIEAAETIKVLEKIGVKIAVVIAQPRKNYDVCMHWVVENLGHNVKIFFMNEQEGENPYIVKRRAFQTLEESENVDQVILVDDVYAHVSKLTGCFPEPNSHFILMDRFYNQREHKDPTVLRLGNHLDGDRGWNETLRYITNQRG